MRLSTLINKLEDILEKEGELIVILNDGLDADFKLVTEVEVQENDMPIVEVLDPATGNVYKPDMNSKFVVID